MLPTGEVWWIPWQQSIYNTRCGMLIDNSTIGEKRKGNQFSVLVKMSILWFIIVVTVVTVLMKSKSNCNNSNNNHENRNIGSQETKKTHMHPRKKWLTWLKQETRYIDIVIDTVKAMIFSIYFKIFTSVRQVSSESSRGKKEVGIDQVCKEPRQWKIAWMKEGLLLMSVKVVSSISCEVVRNDYNQDNV